MSQLDLFEGIVLNQEQQEMIADFKQKQAKAVKDKMLSNERLEGALIEAGFLKDVDFSNTFEPTIVTNDVQLGYSFKGNQFEAKDVTYNTIKGSVCFLSKCYNKRKIKLLILKSTTSTSMVNSNRYFEVKRLKAQFENGSFITFNVNINGEYSINKKYDAVMATADVETAMNAFINQNK
jgi:hypothetical protein